MSNQLAVMQKNISSLIWAEAKRLDAALPADQTGEVANFIASAISKLYENPDLLQAATANPASLMKALNEAARLGLAPGSEHYYLTPRGGKKGQSVLGVVGYQGEIELMYRSGAVSHVIVEAVFENDEFDWDPATMKVPVHKPLGSGGKAWFAGKKKRGALVGAYACAVMKDGSTAVQLADEDRIDAAKEASATADKSFSPWHGHETAMYKKTAVHQLAKFVPTSPVDKRTASAVADVVGQQTVATVASTPALPTPTEGDALEGEVIPHTGELIGEPMTQEILTQARAKWGVQSPQDLNTALAAMFQVEGLVLEQLTVEQGNAVLAELAK